MSAHPLRCLTGGTAEGDALKIAARLVKQVAHGALGSVRITGLDRVEHQPVAGDRVVMTGTVHDPVTLGQTGLQDDLHPLQQLVVRRGKQRSVEGQVGADYGCRVACGFGHRRERVVERAQVGVRAALRGEPRACGLHDAADLMQVLKELVVGAAGKLPSDDVSVKQIPVGPRPHEGPASLPGVHQALRREHLERLAHHGQADVKLGLQRGNVDGLPFGRITGKDALRDPRDGLTVYSTLRIRGHGCFPLSSCQADALTTLQPPSTIRPAPVMNEASSDARKAIAAAASCGRPIRRRTVCAMLLCRSSSLTRSQAAVSIGPGSTQFTRTWGPYSTASWRGSAASPLFAAAYAGCPGRPNRAWTEDVTTTD